LNIVETRINPKYIDALKLIPLGVIEKSDGAYARYMIQTADCEELRESPKYCQLAGGVLDNDGQAKSHKFDPMTGSFIWGAGGPLSFDDYLLAGDGSGNLLIKDKKSGNVLKNLGPDGGTYLEYKVVFLPGTERHGGGTWREVAVLYECLSE
jgi:hypothetical protein